MSLKGIKTLVAELHSDTELRGRFAADPEAVLSRYSLTAEQREAIMGAHLRIGADGALSVEENDGPTTWWLP